MTDESPWRGARTGDLVRAIENCRDATPVEGILHLRYVPSMEYAQVVVYEDQGRMVDVIVESIQVLEVGAVAARQLDNDDPLRNEAGWMAIVDVGQAMDDGLVQSPVVRVGGSWDDLFAELRMRIDPLVESGWAIVSADRDESWEYGDSVVYDLERGDQRLNIEYYEHGLLDVYPIVEGEECDPEDPDAEPAGPLVSIDDSTPELCTDVFRNYDWIS